MTRLQKRRLVYGIIGAVIGAFCGFVLWAEYVTATLIMQSSP